MDNLAGGPADAEPALIHVVDDDPGVRSSLTDLFASVGYEVAAYASPAEFMATEQLNRLGCLVLDVRLQGASGLDFQEQLSRDGSVLPIILISGHGDVPMTVRGMRAGAIDFIEKPFREQHLLDAVALAIKEVQRRAPATERVQDANRRFASLSPRERQIIDLVMTGQLNKQIAFQLSISEPTVKIHRAAAMRKLGVRSLVDLTRLADALGN